MNRGNRCFLVAQLLLLIIACFFFSLRARVLEARVERAVQRIAQEMDASTERAIIDLQRAAWNTPPPIRVPEEK